MLVDLTLKAYLDQLASAAPTPGGGAAAALTGAQGAALVSMVCNLTIGKKKYADVEEEMKAVRERSEALRARLTELIDRDAEAFDRVSAAYGMPKGTEEEKAARRAAIQEALKGAEQVPLETMEACLEVIRLAVVAAQKGNKNVVSDAAVGGILGHAGLLSAADNVRINLNLIKDEAFVQQEQAKLDALLKAAEEAMNTLESALQGKL